MSLTSKTGLTPSPTKKRFSVGKVTNVQLRPIARRAPCMLKPFAGLYNPYPYGCSLLCNHPTDNEARELLRKAKDTWAAEGKNLLLSEEIAAIRAGLEQLQTGDVAHIEKQNGDGGLGVESVPEELFRRYTETDSRPLTPAPTLTSAATRASGSRRCVTPDPAPINQIRKKTLLILDLRRSHSQETLSWHGSSSLQDPPIIRIQRVPTRSGSPEVAPSPKIKSPKHLLNALPPPPPPPPSIKSPKKKPAEEDNKEEAKSDDDDDDEFVKRRGKKRRRKREGSRGPPAFQPSMDPETQVATITDESHDPSARPSITAASDKASDLADKNKNSASKQRASLEYNSYLDSEILKQLRRELNEDVIDNEFNHKRQKALEEAFKSIPKDKTECEELVKLQKELKLPQVNTDFLLSLPRVFTRSSARFELPLDSRTLREMTPLDYVRNHVSITSSRKLLYNCIFNRFKIDDEIEEHDRKIAGKEIQRALDVMMGRAMTEAQRNRFRKLLSWGEHDLVDFKTFCGLCALCERLLAPEYCSQLPDRKADPCHEIETADFEALPRKLYGQEVDENLVEVLKGICSK